MNVKGPTLMLLSREMNPIDGMAHPRLQPGRNPRALAFLIGAAAASLYGETTMVMVCFGVRRRRKVRRRGFVVQQRCKSVTLCRHHPRPGIDILPALADRPTSSRYADRGPPDSPRNLSSTIFAGPLSLTRRSRDRFRIKLVSPGAAGEGNTDQTRIERSDAIPEQRQHLRHGSLRS